jgi:glycosyltransferase involved in cell wall biosynthesis
VHQPWTQDAHGVRAKWLLRTAARLCDRFVCVSEAAERSWFGTSRVLDPDDPSTMALRHVTIHNAVDTQQIRAIVEATDQAAVRRDLGVAQSDLVVGAISRLREEKGIDVLANAFASVRHRVPQARMLVVGDGPDRDALQSQALELGINNSIVWAGARPWSDAIRLMSVTDIVAVPSRFEGFGLSAVEAMACGKPVVASAVGGLPEIVKDRETGLLVPPSDPQAWAEALVRLVGDPGLRQELGANAVADVRRRFGFPVFSARVLAHYKAVGLGCASRQWPEAPP